MGGLRNQRKTNQRTNESFPFLFRYTRYTGWSVVTCTCTSCTLEKFQLYKVQQWLSSRVPPEDNRASEHVWYFWSRSTCLIIILILKNNKAVETPDSEEILHIMFFYFISYQNTFRSDVAQIKPKSVTCIVLTSVSLYFSF